MHSAWVAFIKTGNPNTASLPHWPEYNADARPMMVFDSASRVVKVKEVFNDKAFPSAVFVIKK